MRACAVLAVALACGRAWAGGEEHAARALAATDAACDRARVTAVQDAFIGDCSTDARALFYWVRVSGRSAVAARLEDGARPGDFDVRPTAFSITTTTDGRELKRTWFLGGARPELDSEVERGGAVCPPERYRDHYNRVAATLERPARSKDFAHRRVVLERQAIECKNGVPRVATHKGLIVPTEKLASLAPPPGKLGDDALEVGGVSADVQARPSDPAQAFRVKLRVRAQTDGKVTRVLLQAIDATPDLAAGADALSGDWFELRLAPPKPEPTCDDALEPKRACAAAAAAVAVAVAVAVDGPTIVIARAAGGKLLVGDGHGAAPPNVAVTASGDVLAVDLSGPLRDAASAGVAVRYRDRTSGTVIASANAEHGDYGALDAVGAFDARPYREQSVSLKAAR
jgi:hypothetical protein